MAEETVSKNFIEQEIDKDLAEILKPKQPRTSIGNSCYCFTASNNGQPISAATVALLSVLSGNNISLFDILKITIPCTLLGVLAGAFYSMRVGKELMDDPEYQKRVSLGEFGNC